MCTMTVKIVSLYLVSISSIKPFGPGNENPYWLSKAITITILALIKQYNNVIFIFKKEIIHKKWETKNNDRWNIENAFY